MILCACGCGKYLNEIDVWGKRRKYLYQHQHNGKIPWNKGLKNCYSEPVRKQMSNSHKGKCIGKDNSHYRGGKKLSRARTHNKRKGLETIPLNEPFEGSEGHHINRKDVIFIPCEWHRMIAHDVWKGKNMEIVNSYAYFFLLMQNSSSYSV